MKDLVASALWGAILGWVALLFILAGMAFLEIFVMVFRAIHG